MNSSKELKNFSTSFLDVIDNSFIKKMKDLKEQLKKDEEDAIYFSFLNKNNINPIIPVYQELTHYCQEIENLFITHPQKANHKINELLIIYKNFTELKTDLLSFYEEYKVLPEALALEYKCDKKKKAVNAFHHRCEDVLNKVHRLNDNLLTAPQKIAGRLTGLIGAVVSFIAGAVVGALVGIISLCYHAPWSFGMATGAGVIVGGIATGAGAIVGGCVGAVFGFTGVNRYMTERVFEKKLGFFDNFNKEVKHFVDHHPIKLKQS